MGGRFTRRPLNPLERTPIRFEQEAEWAPEPVWMVLEKRKAPSPPVYTVEINTE